MLMLVNCSNCRTPLQLPPDARSIRCTICSSVTHIADPRALPPPPASSPYSGGGWGSNSTPPPAPSPYGGGWGSQTLPPAGPNNYNPVPPSPHGRKKAVICGISYRNSRHQLKGCINDAKCMKYMLVNRFKFPDSSIVMLTEEERDPNKLPTKQNIRMAIYWLVQGCQPGDTLVFHYSGHGSQQRNYSGDEVDGYDETLCPLDFETQGMLVDDEINQTLVRPITQGVRLLALIDACHSGTALDLPFLCRMKSTGQYVWEDQRPRSGVWKGTSGGEAISISGCDDDQTSADTSALSRVTSTGAMTFCFIQAIERGAASTYGSLLNAMRTAIRNVDTGAGGDPVTSLVSMLLTGSSVSGGLKQEPQLSCNDCFDVYAKPFFL